MKANINNNDDHDQKQITIRQLKSLLYQCKKAFNEIENTRLEFNQFHCTYDIASEISKVIKQ